VSTRVAFCLRRSSLKARKLEEPRPVLHLQDSAPSRAIDFGYDQHVHRDSRRTGLARALSKLGYCSRSRAAETIREGRVTLNGTLRRDPEFPTHPDKDRIAVDGVRVQPGPGIYLMMNKPRGLVTTASDEKG